MLHQTGPGFDNATLKALSGDGELLWAKRGLGKGTLITADGLLYILSDRGTLVLAEMSPEGFRERGVVFVDELEEVPDGANVVFSAHGVSPAVREDADRRGLRVIDVSDPALPIEVGSLELPRYASASSVAVVVPSPAMSEVFEATSRTIWAPMFSNLSASSISFATVTPSLVTVGAPKLFSITTLRPLGPSVTFTALANALTPLRMRSRADVS